MEKCALQHCVPDVDRGSGSRRLALAIPVPDDAMIFAHVARSQVETLRHGRADAVGRNQDASTRGIEAKAMIGAFQTAFANLAGAQGGRAMRTAIGQAHDVPVVSAP